MSAGKCKRGPEKPLGVTSSSSDDDSPGNYAIEEAPSSSTSQSHRRQYVVQQRQHHHTSLQQPGNLSPAPAAAAHTTDGQSATLPIGSTTAHGLSDVDAVSVDYDAVSSPSGSSTLSGSGGSIYERRPGFADHAHSHRVQQQARRPRSKKKKNSLIRAECILTLTSPRDDDEDDDVLTFRKSTTTSKDGNCVEEVFNSSSSSRQQEGSLTSRQLVVKQPVVARSKTHREPIPMRMRALPQSMWQEPNVPHNVSPATVYPVLPPLVTREGDDITSLRPVSPNDDRDESNVQPVNCEKTAKITGCTELSRRHSIHHQQQQQQHHHHTLHLHQQPGERVISVAQPELLQKLFDVLDNKEHTSKTGHRSFGSHAKKFSGGAKKVLIASHYRGTLFTGQDPYMVNNVADSLFPQLCLERGGASPSSGRLSAACGTGTQMVHLQPLPVGDKMIMLPSLIVDQNYPQMLSEIVANM